jgi:putative membrane protein
MLPSLFREAGREGRTKGSYISLGAAAAIVFALLISLRLLSLTIVPNLFWYFFCGICLALSVIAPGLSFSTLLMPLGLYQPFVDGIGEFDFSVLIPAGIGALLTVILFAKAVEVLFRKFYSVSFHAIVGIVIAATVMILPLSGFTTLSSALICVACLVVGIALALLLDRFNRRFESKM